MAGQITNKARVLVRPETSIGASLNSGDDGAGALPLDVVEVSFPEGDPDMLEHRRQIGHNEPTEKVIGGGVGSVNVKFASRGLPTPAGDGVNASTNTEDAITRIIESFTQDRATTAGGAVTSATTSAITCAGTYARNDLILIHEAGLLSPERGNISRNASTGSPYSVDPELEDNYTGAAITYGAEFFRKPDAPSGLGSPLSVLVERDGIQHEIVGARPNSVKVSFNPRGIAMWDVTFVGFKRNRTSYSSLPAHAVPAVSEIQGRVCQLHFNDTIYALGNCEFDFGIQQEFVPGSTGEEGYTDNWITDYTPMVTFTTLYATAWEDAVAASTKGTMLLQIGKGALENSLINTFGIFFEKAQVGPVTQQADERKFRNGVTIEAISPEHPSALGGSERGVLFTVGRW